MRRRKPVLFGLLVSIFAILLFLSAVNIVENNIMSILISSTLIMYGIYALINLNFFIGLLGISFGLKYSPQLIINYVDLTKIGYFKLFIVVVLLSIGLNIIIPKRKKKHKMFYFKSNFNNNQENLNGSHVYSKIRLGESTRYVYSDNLKEAHHSVSLGSMSVFYQEVELHNDVEINVDVSLGNLELYFPNHWHVVDNLSRSLGEVEVQQNFPNSPYTVYVNGGVSLGNIEIKFI